MKNRNRLDAKEGLLILFSTEETDVWYEEFLYGVEEEGLPLFFVSNKQETLSKDDALSLAETAAYYSCFGLGIGIDADKLIVRHRLQKDAAPIFVLDRETDNSKTIRVTGHNAARIIKSLPLMLDEFEKGE